MTPMENIYDFLKSYKIPYQRFDHPAVFTVAESDKIEIDIPGQPTKNLFLRDKGGKHNFLVVVDHHKQVDLKGLKGILGTSNLSFGSAERLKQYLGVDPGSVTLLGIVNDAENAVEVIFDEEIWGKPLQCHPLINTATLVIPFEGVKQFLEATKHSFRVMQVP